MTLKRDVGYRLYFWVTFSILLIAFTSAFLLTGNLINLNGGEIKEGGLNGKIENVVESKVQEESKEEIKEEVNEVSKEEIKEESVLIKGSSSKGYSEDNKENKVDKSGQECLLGDVNLDEEVNIQDLSDLIQYNLGNINLNEEQLCSADYNEDGAIDEYDILELEQFILGNPEFVNRTIHFSITDYDGEDTLREVVLGEEYIEGEDLDRFFNVTKTLLNISISYGDINFNDQNNFSYIYFQHNFPSSLVQTEMGGVSEHYSGRFLENGTMLLEIFANEVTWISPSNIGSQIYFNNAYFSDVENPSILETYACQDWNFESEECDSGWENIPHVVFGSLEDFTFKINENLDWEAFAIGYNLEIPECIPGDVNLDGSINVLDLISLIEYTMDYMQLCQANPSSLCSLDFNQDNYINVLDIEGIAEFILNQGENPERISEEFTNLGYNISVEDLSNLTVLRNNLLHQGF